MEMDWRKALGLGNDQPGPLAFYSTAVACVAIAAASHLAFAHFIHDVTPSVPFYAAIFIAALFGGPRAGVIAAVLSAALAWWVFDSQYFGHRASWLTNGLNRTLYVTAAALVIWTAHRFRCSGNARTPALSADAASGLTGRLRRLGREGLTPNSLAAYGFALVLIALATLVRAGFAGIGGDVLPFACYFPALLAAALVGGMEAGLFAMGLSLLALWGAFDSQTPAFGAPTRPQIVSFALYLFASMLTLWLAESYRRRPHRLGAKTTGILALIAPVVVSFAAVLVTTLVLLPADSHLEAEHLVIGYLLPVTLVAIQFGSSFAFLTSLASVLAASYFLFPPKFSLYIANPLHVAELVLFAVIALIASKIVSLLTHDLDQYPSSVGGHPKRQPPRRT
jgi:hypothetical protein